MFLIALNWLVLLFFFIPSGIALQSFLKIKSQQSFITIVLGIIFQCLALTVCSFFFKIGLKIFIINFLINVFIYLRKSLAIKSYLKQLKSDIIYLSFQSKLILFTIFLVCLYKSAQFPFIIDNESYYIQTIKWINEYGFVKGLGNLHIFLAQMSPFHVLQAGFNFNFLTDRSNDLNGFILFSTSFYFLYEFEKKHQQNTGIHWIGLIPFFNILFYQFLSTPAPDLSIILISQILFYYFVAKEDTFDNFKIISLLFLIILFIKITVAPFILLVIYLAYQSKQRLLFFSTCGLFVGLLFISKNIIISGYPFYPFDILPTNTDWKIPQSLLEFIGNATKKAGYFKNEPLKNPSLYIKLNSWINLGGINRIFNIGILLLFVSGLFVNTIKFQKKYSFLYLTLLIHFIILLLTSPQFRFFLPEFVFLFVLTLNAIINYFCLKKSILMYSIFATVTLPLIITKYINYKDLTKNKQHQQEETQHWQQLIIPERNSKFANLKFELITDGNLNYYSPVENFFFYGTANGHLPCINKVQVNYFKKYFHIIPQLRTTNLEDGFYAKKIINE